MLPTLSLLSLLLIPAMLLGLGIRSHYLPPAGLSSTQLARCPDSPNCICSVYPDDAAHYLPALDLHGLAPEQAVASLSGIIHSMGGTISRAQATYIHATFTSRIFRFVDDLELSLDPDNGLVHFRSASRVGHNDFGTNQQRIDQLQRLWESPQKQRE